MEQREAESMKQSVPRPASTGGMPTRRAKIRLAEEDVGATPT